MHILHSVLLIFLLALVGRMCINSKTFFFGDLFCFSHDQIVRRTETVQNDPRGENTPEITSCC